MTRIHIDELRDPVDIELVEDIDPFIHVPTGVDELAPYHHLLSIDTIHDGWAVPERFVAGFSRADLADLNALHYRERDWGAHWIAWRLATELRLPFCHRVTTARALVDFNRFPGSSTAGTDYLSRLAINPPFSERLSYELKADVLRNLYDRISDGIDEAVEERILKLAIHTYDESNESGTQRPAVSLVNRPSHYQLQATMPLGSFDPMFPAILGEFMASRVLSYRMALSLERGRVPVSMNFPYLLPDGSVEVRSQVWYFFRHLRREYERNHSYTDGNEQSAFALVWTMMLDTNSRSTASVAFREYVHAFGHAPKGLEAFFSRGRHAYEAVRKFLNENWESLIHSYRYSKRRPSSLAIEVRKDFIWDFEGSRPTHFKADRAERIVEGIAQAVDAYMREDVDDTVGAMPSDRT